MAVIVPHPTYVDSYLVNIVNECMQINQMIITNTLHISIYTTDSNTMIHINYSYGAREEKGSRREHWVIWTIMAYIISDSV